LKCSKILELREAGEDTTLDDDDLNAIWLILRLNWSASGRSRKNLRRRWFKHYHTC